MTTFVTPKLRVPTEADIEVESWEDILKVASEVEKGLLRVTIRTEDDIHDCFLVVDGGRIVGAYVYKVRADEDAFGDEALEVVKEALEDAVFAIVDLYELKQDIFELVVGMNRKALLSSPIEGVEGVEEEEEVPEAVEEEEVVAEVVEEEVEEEKEEEEGGGAEDILEQLGIDVESIYESVDMLLEDYFEEEDPVDDFKRMLMALGARDVYLTIRIHIPVDTDEDIIYDMMEDLKHTLSDFAIDELEIVPSLREREAAVLRLQDIVKRITGG